MLASDPTPTLDALATLCTSVLEWNERLDELNSQIARRQVEFARLEECRPPTQSLRNKGSTESLRPRDGPGEIQEDHLGEGEPKGTERHSSSPTKGPKQYEHPGQWPSSAAPAKAAAQTSAAFIPPSQPFSSAPQKSPPLNARPSSSPTSPAQARAAPAKLQKRKPESIISGESALPKYRTRSMIIVYYDSAVQSAFEELVKFVSGSRNAMRKGKMTAKMVEMRRAAEMEVEAEGESEGEEEGLTQLSNALLRGREAQRGKPGAEPDLGLDFPSGIPIPVGLLRGPMPRYTTRSRGLQADGLRSMLNANVIKGSTDPEQDIFEKIDKYLEWCQGQCEFAAHKFLRESECSAEIENIKNKLSEVRSCAEKEVERLKAEESSRPPKNQAQCHLSEEGKCRDQRPIQVRKGIMNKMKPLEMDKMGMDKMEVDDEGFEDMDLSQLVFQRSRDIR